MTNKNMETISTKVEKPVINLLNETVSQTNTQKKDCIALAIVLFAIESNIITEDQVFDYLPEWMANTFDLASRTVNRSQMKELQDQNKALFDLLLSFRRTEDREYMLDQIARIKFRDKEQFDINEAIREVQFDDDNDFTKYSLRDRQLLKTFCIVFRDEIDHKVLELKREGKN